MKRKINKDDIKYLFSNVNYIFPKFLDPILKDNILKNVIVPLQEDFLNSEIYPETLPHLRKRWKTILFSRLFLLEKW